MRTWKGAVAVCGCAWRCLLLAYAQGGRAGTEWTTSGGDAQRSFIRTDPKIASAK